MQSVWNEKILVKSYEVDYNKNSKLNSLFNYMQEAAFNHACILGVGYNDVTEHGLLWVLSRVKIKVIRYPSWGEKITLETWPKGTDRLFVLRDFIFRDENNKQIALATTAWLVLDSKSMKPQRPQTIEADIPYNKGIHAINEELGKIESQDAFEFEFEKSASYSDIDVNNHVNNAKYVEWILDSFSGDFYSDMYIKSLQLNFVSETKLGDNLIIKRGNCRKIDNTYYVEAVNKESGSKIFQSIIEWGTDN